MTKVFHFSNKPPFPQCDGGCVAISSILKSLLSAPNYKVTHYTISTFKHPFDISKYPDSWLKRMRVETGKINTKTDVFGALIHLILNKSYNVARFYDKNIAQAITKILDKDQFDVVIMESIYLLPYLHLFKSKNIKVIVRTHNVEHQIWAGLSDHAHNSLKKWYFRRLSKQLMKYETEMLIKVDGIISITEDDAKFFQQFEPQVLTTSIPTAVKTKFPPTDYRLSDFYFLGAMDWKPNQEGIHWMLEEVIPEGLKGTSFYVAGKNLNKAELDHPTVVNCGEIENAVDFISSHGICIIPMQAGSGLKIKLLENMAMGKPIITTSEGVRGVNVTHHKEVMIADDPDEFRELMYKLFLDEKLRKQLGTQAKKYISDHFSEEKITRRLLAFISDI
ncbi:glycosyltransferase family 4 protein [Brumimicrobium aurantiacum]|uniref:Glycosyltransferase n=1 Tax=Brumimicrobium aurantiacum TaxID=1737063 RepID=A0A3E1F046_9FLAO|nr:glycosyltransferase family 4 protein [Brumimicrobium aurantiacum]RFC55199.1 glycosyltransferase [Brumimicrobium aurantiacum]